MKNILIALEGPDRCGKTQIAAELSKRLGVPTFKNIDEWEGEINNNDRGRFKNLLIHGGPLLVNFLAQTRPNAILDRYYPSEWVYSQHFGRETDMNVLRKIDDKFAEAGGRIVICSRKSFDGIQDDLFAELDNAALTKINSLYLEFAKWTRVPLLMLDVSDECLEREFKEIKDWIENDV